jgi:hypothetical protein
MNQRVGAGILAMLEFSLCFFLTPLHQLVWDCRHLLCNPNSFHHCTDGVILVFIYALFRLVDLIQYVLQLISLSCMIYMMAIIMPTVQAQRKGGMQIVIYITSVLLFVFAIFTLYKVFRRWRLASSVPHIEAANEALLTGYVQTERLPQTDTSPQAGGSTSDLAVGHSGWGTAAPGGSGS